MNPVKFTFVWTSKYTTSDKLLNSLSSPTLPLLVPLHGKLFSFPLGPTNNTECPKIHSGSLERFIFFIIKHTSK